MRNEVKTDRQIGEIDDAEIAQSSNHTAIAKVLSDQEFCEMNVEDKLFLRLLLIEAGTMVGTYRNIGRQFFTKEANIRNWAKKLADKGILTIAPKSYDQVELRLNDRYQAVVKAMAKEGAQAIAQDSAPAIPVINDPELDNIIAIYKTAKATGCSVHLNVEKVVAA